jgi:hypothetical protein
MEVMVAIVVATRRGMRVTRLQCATCARRAALDAAVAAGAFITLHCEIEGLGGKEGRKGSNRASHEHRHITSMRSRYSTGQMVYVLREMN